MQYTARPGQTGRAEGRSSTELKALPSPPCRGTTTPALSTRNVANHVPCEHVGDTRVFELFGELGIPALGASRRSCWATNGTAAAAVPARAPTIEWGGALFEEGSAFDGYRIHAKIGRGGMGIVYKATNLRLQCEVAVKILRPEAAADHTSRERIKQEAMNQARMNDHPHVVTIHDAGEEEGMLFIVMQLVRGPALDNLIERSELDVDLTLDILAQVARALDAAHDRGLVHRDVKPGNILVDLVNKLGDGLRGHAYLADFGIAKCGDEQRLTSTGMRLGTPAYMPPEEVDTPASDIYSLAVVLYECLTGRVPFSGWREFNSYAYGDRPPPRVTDHRSDLPHAIDDVLAKGMATEPSRRHATAEQLISEAKRALSQAPRPVVVRELFPVPHDGAVRAVAFSPDGTLLASAGDDQCAQVWDIEHKRHLLDLCHARHRPARGLLAVAFSPDGGVIATTGRDKTMCVWAASDGRQLRRIALGRWARAVSFSPDGTWIATADDDRTARVRGVSDGLERLSVTSAKAINAVAFSPDGKCLATAGGDRSARLWDLTEERQLRCLDHDDTVWAVAFSADGTHLATASADHSARVWELGEDRAPLDLVHDVKVWTVAFSPDGNHIATGGNDGVARIWDLRDASEVPVAHGGVIWGVAFDADGGRLATASDDHTAKIWAIGADPLSR